MPFLYNLLVTSHFKLIGETIKKECKEKSFENDMKIISKNKCFIIQQGCILITRLIFLSPPFRIICFPKSTN